VLENHHNARIATRVVSRQAWVAAMLLMTLPGTLTMYYDEEIGMTHVAIPPDEVQDPAEKTSRDLAWAATRKELPCRMVPLLLGSRLGGPGCVSAPIMKK
jgi:alpha-glucosidase